MFTPPDTNMTMENGPFLVIIEDNYRYMFLNGWHFIVILVFVGVSFFVFQHGDFVLGLSFWEAFLFNNLGDMSYIRSYFLPCERSVNG